MGHRCGALQTQTAVMLEEEARPEEAHPVDAPMQIAPERRRQVRPVRGTPVAEPQEAETLAGHH
ncbi:MAG: hypothetical protein KDJ17_12805 [Hyphomicrobiaceae bacterium]|nr:hypothetical protein [Hyphomicrobiaceae bacterium]